MRTRPLWTSPSGNLTEFQLPSPTRIQLFNGESPHSIGFSSLSSKFKRDSPASGSWNISEELRKVRSKATEDMLRTLPSSKIDLSALTSENRSAVKSIVAKEVGATMRDKVLTSTKSVDASLNLVTGVTTSYGLPVSQMTQEGLQNEPLSPNRASFISEQNKLHTEVLEDVQTMEETREGRPSSEQRLQPPEEFKTVQQSDADAANLHGIKETNGTKQLCDSKVSGTAQDTELHDHNCSASKETAGKGGLITPDGFPPGSCLSAGQDSIQNNLVSDAKQNPAGSGHDKVIPSVPRGEICEFLSESSVEVPITRDIDSSNTASQNSSSMPSEELSREPNRSSKRSVAGKTSSVREKQPAKKLTRYNRGGRGRGKQ